RRSPSRWKWRKKSCASAAAFCANWRNSATSMIVWISKALALAVHDRQLAEHGGKNGIRDDKLLESALARPRQLHAYADPPPDLADLAASLTFGLARNHPFVDGNKRAAAVLCEAFIVLNGARLEADNLELYPMYLA